MQVNEDSMLFYTTSNESDGSIVVWEAKARPEYSNAITDPVAEHTEKSRKKGGKSTAAKKSPEDSISVDILPVGRKGLADKPNAVVMWNVDSHRLRAVVADTSSDVKLVDVLL